jgi:hypothetical protein
MKLQATCGFSKWPVGIIIDFSAAFITSSFRRNAIRKQTNNQLFILYSADGCGQMNIECPTLCKADNVALTDSKTKSNELRH